MKDFRDLKVWEGAHQLTLDVYRLTKLFPREEIYGLSSQMRRCSALRLERTSLRVAARKETANFNDFYKSLPVRQVSWITTYCWREICIM